MRKKPKLMVSTIPITQARINLGALVKRAHLNKEYFILEKDGIPIAGIMDIDEFEDYLDSQDSKIIAQLRESRADIQAGRVQPAREFLTELKKEKDKKAISKRRKV